MSENKNLFFYLEIIEGKLTEKIKAKIYNFLNILQFLFPDIFVKFELRVKKLYEIA